MFNTLFNKHVMLHIESLVLYLKHSILYHTYVDSQYEMTLPFISGLLEPWLPWLPPGCLLGASWEPPGSFLGVLGASWEPRGSLLGAFWVPSGCLRER